jgi:hypothetical protein
MFRKSYLQEHNSLYTSLNIITASSEMLRRTNS